MLFASSTVKLEHALSGYPVYHFIPEGQLISDPLTRGVTAISEDAARLEPLLSKLTMLEHPQVNNDTLENKLFPPSERDAWLSSAN